jgi:hypothetical protein
MESYTYIISVHKRPDLDSLIISYNIIFYLQATLVQLSFDCFFFGTKYLKHIKLHEAHAIYLCLNFSDLSLVTYNTRQKLLSFSVTDILDALIHLVLNNIYKQHCMQRNVHRKNIENTIQGLVYLFRVSL